MRGNRQLLISYANAVNSAKLGRTQKTLLILLLTIPELVALVPLAMHYLRPSHAARDPKPPLAAAGAVSGSPGRR